MLNLHPCRAIHHQPHEISLPKHDKDNKGEFQNGKKKKKKNSPLFKTLRSLYALRFTIIIFDFEN